MSTAARHPQQMAEVLVDDVEAGLADLGALAEQMVQMRSLMLASCS